MDKAAEVKETCIQAACFFLPFFESGEWRKGGKSPWKTLKKADPVPKTIQDLAAYTGHRMARSAQVMEFLSNLHDDWDVTIKKDGVWMETETMIYERILPKLEEHGFTPEDYVLYSEYTRKWGMI